MGMDQFVTTYRKDYLWPYVKTLGLRPHPEHLFQPQYRDPHRPDLPCECHVLGDPNAQTQQRALLGPQVYEEEAWSRLGPMGPLLDPKIYPAKVSAAPETQVGRFNQPNVFLAKIQEQYPFIYECLRTAPPDDLLARINRDRLRSTYQVDFCRMNEYPSAPYEELLRAAGVDGHQPCASEPVTLPGDNCKIYTKSRVTGSGGGASKGSRQPCGGIQKAKEAQYCEEIPWGTPMQMIRGAKNDVAPPCPELAAICGHPCKPKPRNKAIRLSTITKQFVETSMPRTDDRKTCGSGITAWDPFKEKCSYKSEGDETKEKESFDVIGTWGRMIHRESLHRHHRLK